MRWGINDVVKKLDLPLRYLDEIVHASVNIPSEWLEKRSVSRTEQSFALSMSSYFSIMLPFFKDAFANAINPHALKNAAAKFYFELPILAANMTDTTLEATRMIPATQNGQAVAGDLYSIIVRTARPYILMASSLGVYFGWDDNPQLTKISLESLPWVASMYTRSTYTGGLLQRITEKFKDIAMHLAGKNRVYSH